MVGKQRVGRVSLPETLLDAHDEPDDTNERKGAEASGDDVDSPLFLRVHAAIGNRLRFGRFVQRVDCQSNAERKKWTAISK